MSDLCKRLEHVRKFVAGQGKVDYAETCCEAVAELEGAAQNRLELLTTLRRVRWYVKDALEAQPNSDAQDVLDAIDETLAQASEASSWCETCQNNGEIVTDWDRYLKAKSGDVGDEAVAPCPDCEGEDR